MTQVSPEILAIRPLLDELLMGTMSPEQCERALADILPTSAAVDDVAETVQGLIAGIEEFRSVMGQSASETEALLQSARRRFAIQVSATLLDEAHRAEDSNVPSASTSLKRLRAELVHLAERVSDLVASTIRDSQARKELEIAGAVQKMLVPSGPVGFPGVEAAAWFRPADQCSGDWWTIARLGKDDVLFALGDVTGHGAPAAIVAGTAKGALDMARVGMRDALKPFMAMNMLNFILQESMQGEYYMSAILARVEPHGRVIRIANAGHRPVWIFRDAGVQTIVGERSPPLGSTRDTKYGEEIVSFDRGDILVAFTDGVSEAESEAGTQFGERALREVCERAWRKGPQAIVDAVQRAIQAHAGDLSRLEDDATCIALRAR